MIIVGTYYALVSVVCINLYIALMSETFTRVYENAEANALLQQALLILYLERQLSMEKRAEIKKYFHKTCSPLVSRVALDNIFKRIKLTHPNNLSNANA